MTVFGRHVAALNSAPFSSLVRRDDGNAAVEFSLVAPLLLLLLFGIMETSRAFWAQSALNYAVEQAARCASVDKNTCGTASQIQSYAATQSGANFDTSIFTVSTDACGSLVTASYPLIVAIPYTATSFNLTARSCFPK